MSALAGQQFSYFDGNFYYAVSPCGIVNNATACPNPNYADTMFCQTQRGGNGTSLAQYTAANTTWYASQDGKAVTQMIQDGTPCGNFYREASLIYMCDATATTPVLVNVTEVHTCYYTAYFRTAAACTSNSAASTGINAGVGSTWYDSRCGAGVYDLSPLSNSDLFWTPNATRLDTVWFLRVCGSVSHPNCSSTAGQAPSGSGIPATQTAMLCQSDQTNPTGNDNAAAFYVANQQLWTITNTGLSLAIQDGRSCGTNFPRETTVNFVCNASATTAVMTGVQEVHTCYYTATVQTNLVCSRSAAPASSSSSTGGSVVVTVSSSSRGAASSSSSSSTVPAVISVSSTSTGSPASSSSSSSSAAVAPPANTTVPVSSSTAGSQPPISGNGAASISASAMVMAAVLAVVALML